MFSAKGLAIKRANGEVVTPFYFAYEDLREDWGKLVEQAEAASTEGSEEGEKSKSIVKKLSSKPKVRILIDGSYISFPHSMSYVNHIYSSAYFVTV